jgi:hypothetical protein
MVRDANGRVVAALAQQYRGIFHPTVVESLGAWQAVVLCCELGFPHMTFEGDSMNYCFGVEWTRSLLEFLRPTN